MLLNLMLGSGSQVATPALSHPCRKPSMCVLAVAKGNLRDMRGTHAPTLKHGWLKF